MALLKLTQILDRRKLSHGVNTVADICHHRIFAAQPLDSVDVVVGDRFNRGSSATAFDRQARTPFRPPIHPTLG